jgi:hypothetical protein
LKELFFFLPLLSSAIDNELTRKPFFAAGTGRSSSFLSVGKLDVQLVTGENNKSQHFMIVCVWGSSPWLNELALLDIKSFTFI